MSYSADNEYNRDNISPFLLLTGLKVRERCTALTAAASGVTYTDGLAGLHAMELNEIARAIADNASITNDTAEVWITSLDRHISVGDTMDVKFVQNGQFVTMSCRLMGFNHYGLSRLYDSDGDRVYNPPAATGKAGLLFQTAAVFPTAGAMTSQTGAILWQNGGARGAYPTEETLLLRRIVKAVLIPCAQAAEELTSSTDVVASCFPPSHAEIFGVNAIISNTSPYCAAEGTQYKWYKQHTSASNRIHQNGTTAVAWWTRSPGKHATSGTSGYFEAINAAGAGTMLAQNGSAYFAPCFCI